MLTGDGERTASSVAGSLGIMRFVADAMPDDKEDFIHKLQLQGKTVAMVCLLYTSFPIPSGGNGKD